MEPVQNGQPNLTRLSKRWKEKNTNNTTTKSNAEYSPTEIYLQTKKNCKTALFTILTLFTLAA